MFPTPYVASLRVYEPLSSFSTNDQLKWSDNPRTTNSYIEEQKQAIYRAIDGNFYLVRDKGAHFIEVEGERYIAPWSIAERIRSALVDWKSLYPASLINTFTPQEVENSINLIGELVENNTSHIVTATWSIPPRWFALFAPEDRTTRVINNYPVKILQTQISKAIQRATFTHKTVLKAFGAGPMESEIKEIINWLSIFHGKSIVELDYGGLTYLLNSSYDLDFDKNVDSDTSIEDVASSLEGLASGNGIKASHGYERLISRWRRVAGIESAS